MLMNAEPHKNSLSRRGFLRAGTIGGLSLGSFLELQHLTAAAAKKEKKDVNCIFIFILGGMPHQDMWDLKPDAPSEVRGDFNPIDTVTPGIQVSEIMPRIASVTDKLAILRSLTHTDSDHGRGFHMMMTGVKAGVGDFNGSQNNNQHPSIGSMVARLGRTNSTLPPYISVPNFLNSGGSSFLGAGCMPFVIEADPAAPDFSVRDVTLPAAVTSDRSRRRQSALQKLNRFERDLDRISDSVRSLDTFYQKAYGLMTSREARAAFDIGQESDDVRQDYGMTSMGQCCLLGRRLVEAGCLFVSIENGHWDTHRKNTWSLKELLVPAFDRAVPALLNDLEERGMLDSTLVVITTEFGRTPRINQLAGRDHWPQAFSVCLAGAGLKVGQVIGATDKQAASVADRPISPQDLTATILKVLDIDPKAVIPDTLGRPIQLVSGGEPVSELF